MRTPPRLALLGCGYWGQNLARNFHQLGALALVCDPAETGRLKAQQIAPGTEVCDRFEPVFDRADIDAVVIATPAETHFDLVMHALKAGKDVLVEKGIGDRRSKIEDWAPGFLAESNNFFKKSEDRR
jgi:predicted dehydrogenase